MATWNKKRRQEMAAYQRIKDHPPTPVFCRKCDKVHKHPVCNPNKPVKV